MHKLIGNHQLPPNISGVFDFVAVYDHFSSDDGDCLRARATHSLPALSLPPPSLFPSVRPRDLLIGVWRRRSPSSDSSALWGRFKYDVRRL